jgi:DUF4097 and DUF4098 domain-containing protein YvlB
MHSRSRAIALLGTVISLGLAVIAASLSAEARDYKEEFHKTYPLTADGRISLKNINGAVIITAWDKNEVQVDAMKTASSQDKLAEAKIEVTAGSSAIDIRTQYPEGSHNNPASVAYTLYVPRTARLDKIELVNGKISIVGVQGNIHASSVNGSVEATNAGGKIHLSSVNGHVLAEMQALLSPVSLETVNGGVEVKLASNANVEISASTVHGGISNDFNIPVNRERWVGSELRARLGEGGPAIKLAAVNGGIHITRASDGKPLSKVTNLLPEDKRRFD